MYVSGSTAPESNETNSSDFKPGNGLFILVLELMPYALNITLNSGL
jgi:hypothetical protein